MFKECLLVLGDQLFPTQNLPVDRQTPIVMFEDYELGSRFKYHKHKLILFLAAMREYRDELKDKGYKVFYFSAEETKFKDEFFEKLETFLKSKKIEKVRHYEIADRFFAERLQKLIDSLEIDSYSHKNPMFLTSREEFKEYLDQSKKVFLFEFYKRQRLRLNLLLNKDKSPKGGHWSFDKDNRKKYPKDVVFQKPQSFEYGSSVKAVKKVVGKHFKDHPGDVENFWLPVNRKQALDWLAHFLSVNFSDFGPYEDAIHNENVLGFHSVLSPLMNCGLLTPSDVLERVLKQHEHENLPIESVEGFVRQVIGWREFVRGIYDNFLEKMESDNYWQHNRKFQSSWYKGETGLLPFDDSVKKAEKLGYVHHIERLMIQSNLMLLCEIDPRQVHQWFMEFYVDSADWVMAANVYGMGQMSEGGIFATKPYVCGSNYILKMSNYKKGDWCNTLDGLYWRFIEKNQKALSKNPRMSMMVRMLERLPSEKKKTIFQCAENFLENHTQC